MANANKNKGDRGEREARDFLRLHAADLIAHFAKGSYTVEDLDRKLGAGRATDTGDIFGFGFDDEAVTIQVKSYKRQRLNCALIEAARGAYEQARNAKAPLEYAVGLSIVERARLDGTRWLASSLEWPFDDGKPITLVKTMPAAINHVLSTGELVVARDIYVAPAHVWLDALRRRMGLIVPVNLTQETSDVA